MTEPDHRRRIDAYGVCRNASGATLLVRAGPDSPVAGAWLLPGGRIRHGERPAAAVVRAVAEQAGLGVAATAVRDVVTEVITYPGGAVHHDRVLFDVAVDDREPVPPGWAGLHADALRWASPAGLAAAVLVPFTAAALGVPVRPLAAPRRPRTPPDGVDRSRRQRFAAYGLVADPGDRLLLTRIAEGFPGAGRWHLPGGGTDFGEAPRDGLLRELVEESGQHGRITGVLSVSDRRNPAAVGPEGHPIDWHAVRVLYTVSVDVPTQPSVTEAAGGSTAEAAWFPRSSLDRMRLTEVVGVALRAARRNGIDRGIMDET